MARRIYMHIGTMKAATSYLQSMFDLNRERLAEHGVLWQSSAVNQNAIHEFQGSPMLAPHYAGSWPELRREVRRTDGDVLISMELLARIPLRRVQRLVAALAPEELHVIITARDLSRIAPSHWQETTQNRATEPWAEWIEKVCTSDPREAEERMPFWQHQYLPAIIEKWSQVAAPGGVHLVTIPQERGDSREVWRRFASVIGVPADGFEEPRFSNAAIGGTSAELMRRLNTMTSDLDFNRYRWGFKAALAKRTLAKRADSEPRPTLPPHMHARLHEIAKDMVEQVASSGVHVVGDLDDLLPKGTPKGDGYDPGQSTDSELLEVALEGLVSLGTEVSDLRMERTRLRRKNAALRQRLRAGGISEGRLDDIRERGRARVREARTSLRTGRIAHAARAARQRLRRRPQR